MTIKSLLILNSLTCTSTHMLAFIIKKNKKNEEDRLCLCWPEFNFIKRSI